jgi:hypothetical protein
MRLSTTANRIDGEIPKRFRGPLSVVGWDGVLPLVAAGIPLFVRATLPQNQAAHIIVVLFVPILTALVRTSVGWNQIARICNGRAPWHRQTALAAAIVLLLLFEACSAALIFTDNAPVEALLVPLALYCLYLLIISIALKAGRPRIG